MDLAGSLIVLLTQLERWPEVARVHRDAWLYPEALPVERPDLAAHRRAWLRAMVRDAPTMVLTDRAGLLAGSPTRLAAAAGALDGERWDVLHLDAGRQGEAYVVTPVAAALLVELADDSGAASLDELLELAEVDVLAVDPPVAVVAEGAPDLPEGSVAVASDFELALADAAGDDLVTVADGAAVLVAVGGRLLDATTGRPAMVLAGEPDDVEALLARARASEGDGLGALFAYQGALPASAELAEVGDELVTLSFWTPAFCATVIRAAEGLGAWTSDPSDPVPGHEVSLAVLCPRLFAHVEDHLAALVVPRLRYHWPTLEYHGLRDAFVIKYTTGSGAGLRLHHDVAQLSASVRLNDQYEGGALVFPRQDVTNAGLAVGDLLAWPSLVTHPHAAEPVTAGVKYGLTIWFELPGPREG